MPFWSPMVRVTDETLTVGGRPDFAAEDGKLAAGLDDDEHAAAREHGRGAGGGREHARV